MNKKQYIIPIVEVVEIKTCQLLMTSEMDVLDGELEDSEDILAREFEFDEFEFDE